MAFHRLLAWRLWRGRAEKKEEKKKRIPSGRRIFGFHLLSGYFAGARRVSPPMPLPYLLPTGPAAFIDLDTCAQLPAGRQTIARPQAGAAPFACPFPCAADGTPACRLRALRPSPAPARVTHYTGYLRLRATAAALLAGVRTGPARQAADAPGPEFGGVAVRPPAVGRGPAVSVGTGTISGRLGLN